MTILFIIFGAVLGAVLNGLDGFFWGGLIGYMFSAILDLKGRVEELEKQVKPDKETSSEQRTPVGRTVFPLFEMESTLDDMKSDIEFPHVDSEPARSQEHERQEVAPQAPLENRVYNSVLKFFSGEDLLVKIGVVILFLGVSFLLKYAIDQGMLPVEFRLIGAAVGGVALIMVGWRLRDTRRIYGLVIQGGGIGIVYLTIFAAFRLYGMIPPVLAFTLLFAVCALSSFLAVMQNSLSLAVLGSAGGFLAPVLISTGGGRHVALFSYYSVLNLGILWISWYRTWRALNLLGFTFTFVIGSMWGYKYYRPELFASTEPFLVLFFVMYSAIAILFALRQPLRLTGLVDGSIVFGAPVVAFALQERLVAHYEYGLAWSSFALGVYYLFLAWLTFHKYKEKLQLLAESFLAFNVVFLTLTIPLALDGRWTSAAWALEGAALVWLGVRQDRWLAKITGVILQLASGYSFIITTRYAVGPTPLLNGYFLGCVILSLAGFFTAYYIWKNSGKVKPWERSLEPPLMLWGLIWWLWGGYREIDTHIKSGYDFNTFLVFLALSALAMAYLRNRLEWRILAYPARGVLFPVGLMVMPFMFLEIHPFDDGGMMAWPLAVALIYAILYLGEEDAEGAPSPWLHAGALWITTFLVIAESTWHVRHLFPVYNIWAFIIHGAAPAFIALMIITRGHYITWPFQKYRQAYMTLGIGPLLTYALIWMAWANLSNDGNPYPIPYLPILNPLDMAMAFVTLVAFSWALTFRKEMVEEKESVDKLAPYIYAPGLFLWFNAILARTVHWWGQVPFNFDQMLASSLFQVTISISWSILALFLMVFATRKANRSVWVVGAFLQGSVVIKMFLVDLSRTGTMERIISFVGVGALLLVIGYFSPIPPQSKEETA